MDFILTGHARKRMSERNIPEHLIAAALRNPTKRLYDSNGRLLIKRLYRKNGKDRLLLIAGEMEKNILRIITVIDTSKVKKYL